MKIKKILIIDDDESFTNIVKLNLEEDGEYSVRVENKADLAPLAALEFMPDLILLDMIMDPGINGRETYERIIKISPGQKAVIASGFAETMEVKAAQELGAGRYIRKPFSLENLGMAVKEELEKKSS